MEHQQLIEKFYTAFQNRDYTTMQSCYHADATFHDPVFPNLDANQVRAMWQMLLTSAKDLKVTFDAIQTSGSTGSCNWQAWYTFSKTGRPVHNIIQASFDFKDGKILRHRDSFDLWRWSRMALGTSGLLLGWSPIVQNKIRSNARAALQKYIAGR
jgi:ketosteroid isomerase-like protein